MQPQSLLVVDIETVPDKSLHEGDKFPILPFHQVVAIAFLEAEIGRSENGESYTLKELRCGGEADYSEEKLLQAFFQFFEHSKPRLVSKSEHSRSRIRRQTELTGRSARQAAKSRSSFTQGAESGLIR